MTVTGPQSSVNLQRMICGYDEVRKHHSTLRSTQTVTVKKKKIEELSREERRENQQRKRRKLNVNILVMFLQLKL